MDPDDQPSDHEREGRDEEAVDDDGQRPPEMAERVAKTIPGAKYLLADTGHFMNLETPQLFVDTIVPFLASQA